MYFEVVSDKGLKRKENEDSFLALLPEGLFAVADGMGGHAAGKLASTLAVETMRKNADLSSGIDRAKMLNHIVLLANNMVFEESVLNKEYAGMGTTLTAVLIAKKVLYLAHVGDSRAYICRENKIILLTQDHSMVHEMYNNGEISYEEMQKHPRRNVLTRALGIDPILQIEEKQVELKEKDLVLLCTDGLHGCVADNDIAKVLSDNTILKEKAEELRKIAYTKGATDNITLILIEIGQSLP